MKKIFAQIARLRDENGIGYIKRCYSNQTDNEVMEDAFNFYEKNMVILEKRSNVCEVFWSGNLQRYVTIPTK